MLYDDQATRFDERAAIPVFAAEAVAREVVAATGVGRGDLLLEVGAGTGSLSRSLVRWVDRYLGFDRSPAMVEVSRGVLGAPNADVSMVVADGNERWPADDNAAAVVFSARAIHHLEPAHAAAEALRVLRPGGWLLLGRVRRPPDSPKSLMRREMRRLVAARGLAARSQDAGAEAVFSALERRGAVRQGPRVAASWTAHHRPADSLAAWEGKRGLAGIDLAPEVKAAVLAEVAAWAEHRFGSLDAEVQQEESFEIAAIRLPA